VPRRREAEKKRRKKAARRRHSDGQEEMMGLASYEIVGSAGKWRVRHDGRADNAYQTKESAFEAAVAAASLALRQGHDVKISAPGSETATGAANAG
jgi:Skp family chaperone for outer membrane proteins